MRCRRYLVLALVLAAAAHAPAAAQVFTPSYQSSRLISDLGIYLHSGPGDLGVEGIWRGGPLGLRVGYVDAAGGLLSIGGEVRNPIPVANAPLGLAFTLAGQGLVGDHSGVGFAAGLTAGATFMAPGVAITPYIHPRVALVSPIGARTDFGVEALADIGVDVEFWTNLIFRLGVSLADVGSDVGFGIAVRR